MIGALEHVALRKWLGITTSPRPPPPGPLRPSSALFLVLPWEQSLYSSQVRPPSLNRWLPSLDPLHGRHGS